MSRYDEIILSGKYVDGFLGAALSENLVNLRDKESSQSAVTRARKSRYKTKSLELFLLFDKIHLRYWHPAVSIPSLKEEGRVTTASRTIDRAGQFLEAHHEDSH